MVEMLCPHDPHRPSRLPGQLDTTRPACTYSCLPDKKAVGGGRPSSSGRARRLFGVGRGTVLREVGACASPSHPESSPRVAEHFSLKQLHSFHFAGVFLMGSKGFSNIKWSMCRAGLAENSGPGPAPGAQHDHRPPGLQRQRPRCDSSSLLRGRHPCQDVTHSSPSAHAWHSLLSADTSGMRRAKGPDGSVGQDAAAWALNTLKRVLRVSGFLG